MLNYDSKFLKPYKGYQIEKIWDVSPLTGKKINTVYEVSDNDGNGVEIFSSLKETKQYIDTILIG